MQKALKLEEESIAFQQNLQVNYERGFLTRRDILDVVAPENLILPRGGKCLHSQRLPNSFSRSRSVSRIVQLALSSADGPESSAMDTATEAFV